MGFLSAFLGSLLVFNLQVNFGDVCNDTEFGKNWFPGRHRESGGGGVARRTRRHRASQLRRPDGGRRMQAGNYADIAFLGGVGTRSVLPRSRKAGYQIRGS